MNYFFFFLFIFCFTLSANGYGETFQKLCPNSTFEFNGKEVNGFYELKTKITYCPHKVALELRTKLEKSYLTKEIGPVVFLENDLKQISKKENEAFIFDPTKIKEGSYWDKQILKLVEIRLLYDHDKMNGQIYHG